MRKELYLVVAMAFLLILSACTANQDEEPQIGQSSAQSSVEEMDDSMESSSEEMEEQTETNDSAEKVEMAEDQPAMKESDQEDSASESNQMADDEHPEVEEMEQVEETSEEANMEESDAQTPGGDLPAWQQLPITNARTGDSFTLADFAGKTVFVEPMATWCGNCRRQLTNVREAREQLASDDVVFIALSVETNVDDTKLANYADGEGFEWLFAVLTPELLRELAGEFGQTITNPPSTPHFVIRPDGTNTELVTGIEPAGDILAQIAAAQG
jgi:thiol-disulfide isomerase/thioredoxin